MNLCIRTDNIRVCICVCIVYKPSKSRMKNVDTHARTMTDRYLLYYVICNMYNDI